MSYCVRIYTIKKQNFDDLRNQFNVIVKDNGFVIPLKERQIVIEKEVDIEDEDIPSQISRELPGLKHLIECNLEPITSNQKHIKELIKIAKTIAQEGIGVVEDLQTDEIFLPSGLNRVLQIEKTERFSIVELSWWFNDSSFLKNGRLQLLLKAIERYLPEALPRRYGEYEPPKEKFKDLASFHDYIIKHSADSIVWYPSKPVDCVSLNIPQIIGPASIGYKFGHLSISIDAAILDMPGWSTTIERLFKNISAIINPFYGDIYILENQIRSRTTSYFDSKTDLHPICNIWWNGIPRKLGIGLVIGEPLHNYAEIINPTFVLDNGCKLIINNQFSKILPKDVKINKNILQPIDKNKQWIGFDSQYPKIWPFIGPKDPKIF